MNAREVLMEAFELVPITGPGVKPGDEVHEVFDSFEAAVIVDHALAALKAEGLEVCRLEPVAWGVASMTYSLAFSEEDQDPTTWAPLFRKIEEQA